MKRSYSSNVTSYFDSANDAILTTCTGFSASPSSLYRTRSPCENLPARDFHHLRKNRTNLLSPRLLLLSPRLLLLSPRLLLLSLVQQLQRLPVELAPALPAAARYLLAESIAVFIEPADKAARAYLKWNSSGNARSCSLCRATILSITSRAAP